MGLDESIESFKHNTENSNPCNSCIVVKPTQYAALQLLCPALGPTGFSLEIKGHLTPTWPYVPQLPFHPTSLDDH